MIRLEHIVAQITAEYRDPRRCAVLSARAMIDQLTKLGHEVDGALSDDILARATGKVIDHVTDPEANQEEFLPWERPRACSIKSLPHREIDGLHGDFVYRSGDHQMVLDKQAFEYVISQDTIDDEGLSSILITDKNGEQSMLDAIRGGYTPFDVNIQPHAVGRFYALGSYSWQSAKPVAHCLRWAKPYKCTADQLAEHFEFSENPNQALSAMIEPLTNADDIGKYNEGLSYTQAMSTGMCNHMCWKDMSASGAWFIGALTGDHVLWKDLLTGDLYSKAGMEYRGLREAMNHKMFRQLMKVLLMLTMYSITGYGLTRSLYNNHPELFSFLWVYFECGDDTTNKDNIQKMEKELGKMIMRLLYRYDGLKRYREWALTYGYVDKQPPKLIEWNCDGFTASHLLWGWETYLTLEETMAQIVISLEPQHPLSTKGLAKARTPIMAPTQYGPREINLWGRNFNWGHGKRGFGPKLIHSCDAWAIAHIGLGILKDGAPFVGNHDAATTDIHHLSWINPGFRDVIPKIVNSIRKQFPTLPVNGDIDWNTLKDVEVFR